MDENNKHISGKKRLLSSLAVFLMSGWVLAPAYASDTEVYARTVDFSADTTPVLMMVLDSSGSMNDCLENCPNGLTRIGALRNAMRKVLFGDPVPTGSNPVVKPAPDFIKMGYTRFNPDANDGGWTRYPALKLSSVVPDRWTEQSTIDLAVRSDADDVYGTTLSNGNTYSVGSTMDSLGLRFTDVQIPRNATITGAMLLFTSDGSGSIPRSLKVAIDNVGDSAALTGAGTGDRATWTANVSLDTDTNPNPFWVDVRSLVQTVVNKDPGWCGGNALTLRVNSDGGSRTTKVWSATYAVAQKRPDLAPRLIVSYEIKGTARANSCISAPMDYVVGVKNSLDDIEWPEGAGNSSIEYSQSTIFPAAIPDGVRQMTAIRFPNLPVPAGATIDKAWLYLTSSRTATTAATVRVSAFDTSNLPEFCTVDAVTKRISCSVPAYSPTVSSTLTLPATPATTGTDGVHRVVNVTGQVNAVVSRIGWAPNNAIGFLLHADNPLATSSDSSLHTADSAVSKAAFLHVIARKTFTDLDRMDKTARQDLFDDINARMYASGGTPLGDAYVEAARYMLGMNPYSVDSFTSTFEEQAPEQTYYQPDPRTADAANKYVSPLEDVSECSANYIYLMSDGEPNNASNVNNNSKGVTDGYNADCNAYSSIPLSSGNSKANFACMLSVAKHLASGKNQKKAVIRTNTVLFDDALTGAVVTDMERVSKDAYGKGEFFHAKTSAQLTDSLLKTMTRLIDTDGSITAPGVAVNQFNRLTHLDQLYYAVFKPEARRARWLGNVKRYRLRFDETVLNDGTQSLTSTIVDADNKSAIDPATTFFAPGSRSFWRDLGDGPDGADVAVGGAAGKIPYPTSRKIYTYLPAYTGSTMDLVDLDSVTAADGLAATGLTAARQFSNLRKWLKGYRIDIVNPAGTDIRSDIDVPVSASTLLRNELGGVLHSQPVLVNYGYTSATAVEASQDPSKQDNMVFYSTQEGMLHAVDANTGVEKFAFMPKETLARLDEFAINGSQDLPEFGLDSSWTVLRIDANKDGKITTGASGDKVWLFGGMRMGGRNYYALDVTDRNSPKLKWVKRGGVDANFLKMGQTWSKPALGEVKIGTAIKTVLFFAGGYDPKHETAGYTSASVSDAQGNQLYIVDPDSGNLIWWASNTGANLNHTDMKFSITAEPKLFDANKDGLVDAVYVGDLGGQVFRIDIKNGNSAATLGHRIKRLANIGQGVTANTVNQRRFYETPSVAMLLDPATNLPYVVVAMGTGYRSHPLDLDTQDAFYVFKDTDVLRGDLLTVASSSLQAVIAPSDLAEIDLDSPSGVDLTDKMGWMLDLPEEGEKVLATPIILFGEVFFSSYLPRQSLSSSKCSPVIGATKLWRMGVRDGAALRDLDNDGDIDESDRYTDNVVQGLGGAPQLIVGEDGRNVIITGTGVVRNNDLNSASMRRTRWYQKGNQ